VALGGQWRSALTKDITHLFAISPNSDKYLNAMHYKHQTHMKILLPHWFDDVMRLGIGTLSTTPYEWPDPAYLKAPAESLGEDKLDNTTSTPNKKTRKLESSKRTFFKTAFAAEPPSSLPTMDVWGHRHILLSTTLELNGGRREAVEIDIKRAQGIVVSYASRGGDGDEDEELDKVDECDVYITRYRTGKPFFKVGLCSHSCCKF
jgi:hypothetical protein